MNDTAHAMESREQAEAHGSTVSKNRKSLASHLPTTEMLVKGIATGIAVSTITQTGRRVMSALVKNPIVMLGAGFAAGYFAHKYRKQIIAATSSAAEQSKDFVLRQKENLEDLLAENQEEAEESASRS